MGEQTLMFPKKRLSPLPSFLPPPLPNIPHSQEILDISHQVRAEKGPRKQKPHHYR